MIPDQTIAHVTLIEHRLRQQGLEAHGDRPKVSDRQQGMALRRRLGDALQALVRTTEQQQPSTVTAPGQPT